jgi:hypothetical protein
MAAAGAGGPTVGISAGVIDLQVAPVGAFGRIQLLSDGTVALDGNGSHSNTWYSAAPFAGIGNDYWVKFHLSSGTAWVGAAADTVLALSGNPTLSWTCSSGQIKIATVAVTFYADSGGANQVGAGTITADVESTP